MPGNRARARELAKRNRLLVRQEKLAAKDVAAIIRAIARQIAERYSYGSEEAMLRIVDDQQAAIAKKLEYRLLQTAMIFGVMTLEAIEKASAKSYYPNIPIGLGPVRGRDEAPIEIKGAREIFENAVRAWVITHALDRATTITGTIRAAVAAVLAEGFADGLGEAGTVKIIREKIGRRLSATNAARIARTEMHTAMNIGADEAARSTGLDMVKEWASAEDSRVRKSHAEADGQEVAEDDPFHVGSARLMFPGDPAGPAKEIINCRCAVLHHPVIGGEIIR